MMIDQSYRNPDNAMKSTHQKTIYFTVKVVDHCVSDLDYWSQSGHLWQSAKVRSMVSQAPVVITFDWDGVDFVGIRFMIGFAQLIRDHIGLQGCARVVKFENMEPRIMAWFIYAVRLVSGVSSVAEAHLLVDGERECVALIPINEDATQEQIPY